MSKFATTACVAKWTSKLEVWSSNAGECKIIKKNWGVRSKDRVRVRVSIGLGSQ